jgi:exodeoxyribonuclease VII large subunit
LRVFSGKLELLSPLAVLRRGYSVVFRSRGTATRRAAELEPGEEVRILLAEGAARARIERVEGEHG